MFLFCSFIYLHFDSQITREILHVLYKHYSADAMFDLADTSGDGLLSREEFMYYMQSHTDHTKAMIRDAFYMIDVDGNGDITRDEVRNAFLKKRRDLKGETLSESKRTMEGKGIK